MSDLINIKLTIKKTQLLEFNSFCKYQNITYTSDNIKLGNISQHWVYLNNADASRIVNDPLFIIETMNVPGVYALGYGNNFDSVFASECIYIGESSSQYGNKKRTGIGQRIMMAIKDFHGQSSNHNKKFYNKRSYIASHFNYKKFNYSKLKIAFRPHEEYAKWDKIYSHSMEILAIETFKHNNKCLPICNHMAGTFTT